MRSLMGRGVVTVAVWSVLVTVFGGMPARTASYGLLRVVSSPALPTQIMIDGNIADSWGLTWLKLPPGTHAVSFTHVQGYTEPAPQTVTVNPDATTTVTGAFTRRGELRVITSPAVNSQITVDGNPANDWGVWTDVPAGPHQVCFGKVAGYDPPPCQSAVVAVGALTAFTGVFTANPAGVGQGGVGFLRVATSLAPAPQITITPLGGSPYIADSWGLNWLKLPPGSYTVSFSHVQGWAEPAPQTITITLGNTTTVMGTFTQRGSLRVITSPAIAGTIGVDGVARDDWGMWTDMPTGSHAVCFGPGPRYNPPPCQTITVDPGVETDVTGIYTSPGRAWGRNIWGDLGNGTSTDSSLPVSISMPSGTTVTTVAGGGDHSLALTSTGSVLAWGLNNFGQLGNDTTASSSVPIFVNLPTSTTVIAIAAGQSHSLALTSTGSVLAWGRNNAGQLGNNSTTDSRVPVLVSLPGGTTVTGVAAGFEHSLAVTSTGSVLAWGANYYGQLGSGTYNLSSVPLFVSLPSGTTATSVAGGQGNVSRAVTSTGSLLAWGGNYYGQLGNGTNNSSSVPVFASLPSGTRVTAAAGGLGHSLALTSTGSVLAWGSNGWGSLGNGTWQDSNVPVFVSLPSGTTVTALASGTWDGHALTSTGSVLAWGRNLYGQLGDGTKTDRPLPVFVSLPSGTTVTAIGSGAFHSLAIVQ